jgi:hypothetical protein
MVSWGRLIVCRTADLIGEDQSRRNGISGVADLAGMVMPPEAFRGSSLQAYHNGPLFHKLGPNRQKPKLGAPAQSVLAGEKDCENM